MVNSLKNIKLFDPSIVKTIAMQHNTLFKNRVTKKGLDFAGDRFPPYSERYEELKETDFRDEEGKRYAGYRGLSLSNEVNVPDFQLTLKTMMNLKIMHVKSDSYMIGWNNERAIQIVEANAMRKKRKRDIKSGVPDSEINKIVDLFDKEIERQLNKV